MLVAVKLCASVEMSRKLQCVYDDEFNMLERKLEFSCLLLCGGQLVQYHGAGSRQARDISSFIPQVL